jgi:putative membrane protein
VAFLGVLSKVYELAEWLIAIGLSPAAAENYNGQQGDPFDAQKDMALALVGSLLSSPLVAIRLARHGDRAAADGSEH